MPNIKTLNFSKIKETHFTKIILLQYALHFANQKKTHISKCKKKGPKAFSQHHINNWGGTLVMLNGTPPKRDSAVTVRETAYNNYTLDLTGFLLG